MLQQEPIQIQKIDEKELKALIRAAQKALKNTNEHR